MNEKFIVIDATDDIVIGGFGNLEGNLGLLKYSYEEISQKMKENNNKEEDIRLVNSLLDSIRELQQENQELKKQLEELDSIVGLSQKRNLINKFNKEYDEEYKKKNPNRNHATIIPDAEEVYKRYYEMKNQQKVFIQWLENKMNETHYTMFEFQAYHLAFEKYKEIIGEEKCEK